MRFCAHSTFSHSLRCARAVFPENSAYMRGVAWRMKYDSIISALLRLLYNPRRTPFAHTPHMHSTRQCSASRRVSALCCCSRISHACLPIFILIKMFHFQTHAMYHLLFFVVLVLRLHSPRSVQLFYSRCAHCSQAVSGSAVYARWCAGVKKTNRPHHMILHAKRMSASKRWDARRDGCGRSCEAEERKKLGNKKSKYNKIRKIRIRASVMEIEMERRTHGCNGAPNRKQRRENRKKNGEYE